MPAKPRNEKTPAASTAGVQSAQSNAINESTKQMNSIALQAAVALENTKLAQLIAVLFGNDTVILVEHDAQPYVVMKPLVTSLGLDWRSQHVKLLQKFAATVVEIPTVAEDGKLRNMTMKKLLITVAAAVALAGCATRGADFSPIVDSKDRDAAAIATNTAECQEYARTQAGAGGGAVVGAIVGALFMAALAPHGNRNDWARSGAIVGGAGGAVGANDSQEAIIRKCLQGRGFSVLN